MTASTPGPSPVETLLAHLGQSSYAGTVATPASDPALHSRLCSRWDTFSTTSPPLAASPSTEADVALLVRAARATGLDVSVRCGGHSTQRGAATATGLAIHLGQLQATALDKRRRLMHVDGGCLWDDVYRALDADGGSGLLAVGGGVWMVGVGGFLTGGGYSFWSAKFGMGCDQVVAARVVTGTGDVVVCDRDTHPELFWAIRGGSSNFGIVTRFTLRLYDEPPPGEKPLVGAIGFPGHCFDEVMKAVEVFYSRQTDSEAIVVSFVRLPPDGKPAIMIMPWVTGTPSYHATVLEPFTALGPAFNNTWVAATHSEFAHSADELFSIPGPTRRPGKGLQLRSLDFAWAAALWRDWLSFSADPRFAAAAVLIETHHYARLGDKVGGDNAWRNRNKHMYVRINAT
ncbi:hypothetical protein BD289DRAFT_500023 [Coniella lustricola]|uniref:FAD-binding PCMH-type domain-containing protein n=1 Tax=Coniella lustricola TaxID=2025994 RepID=A0A2T3A7S8_9PEZI|nr:hypothetical protein BD289DRAFT_500023 [Coniella lustricola]